MKTQLSRRKRPTKKSKRKRSGKKKEAKIGQYSDIINKLISKPIMSKKNYSNNNKMYQQFQQKILPNYSYNNIYSRSSSPKKKVTFKDDIELPKKDVTEKQPVRNKKDDVESEEHISWNCRDCGGYHTTTPDRKYLCPMLTRRTIDVEESAPLSKIFSNPKLDNPDYIKKNTEIDELDKQTRELEQNRQRFSSTDPEFQRLDKEIFDSYDKRKELIEQSRNISSSEDGSKRKKKRTRSKKGKKAINKVHKKSYHLRRKSSRLTKKKSKRRADGSLNNVEQEQFRGILTGEWKVFKNLVLSRSTGNVILPEAPEAGAGAVNDSYSCGPCRIRKFTSTHGDTIEFQVNLLNGTNPTFSINDVISYEQAS